MRTEQIFCKDIALYRYLEAIDRVVIIIVRSPCGHRVEHCAGPIRSSFQFLYIRPVARWQVTEMLFCRRYEPNTDLRGPIFVFLGRTVRTLSHGVVLGVFSFPLHKKADAPGQRCIASGRRGGGWKVLRRSDFASSVDVGLCGRLVVEDLFRFEEACELDGSVGGGVAGVHDVLLVGHGVVTADGAGGCLASVGGARHGAHHLHGVETGDGESDDGRRHHGGGEGWEEGSVGKVGIVLTQDGLVELHHLDTGDAEPAAFETLDDFSDELPLHAAGFE